MLHNFGVRQCLRDLGEFSVRVLPGRRLLPARLMLLRWQRSHGQFSREAGGEEDEQFPLPALPFLPVTRHDRLLVRLIARRCVAAAGQLSILPEANMRSLRWVNQRYAPIE